MTSTALAAETRAAREAATGRIAHMQMHEDGGIYRPRTTDDPIAEDVDSILGFLNPDGYRYAMEIVGEAYSAAGRLEGETLHVAEGDLERVAAPVHNGVIAARQSGSAEARDLEHWLSVLGALVFVRYVAERVDAVIDPAREATR
jgi:hypothetical protein